MNKIKNLFINRLIPLMLSISSFSGILLFLFIGRKIDIPFINLGKNNYFEILNSYVFFKYIFFVLIIFIFALITIKIAGKFLNKNEKFTIKEIKPIEFNFLPVYLGLFVITLGFPETNITIESYFLLFIMFLFWLYLEGVSYFNPFLLVFGYRFYEAKTEDNITITLISKTNDMKTQKNISNAMRINNFTFLYIN